jgi:hypothetical protein
MRLEYTVPGFLQNDRAFFDANIGAQLMPRLELGNSNKNDGEYSQDDGSECKNNVVPLIYPAEHRRGRAEGGAIIFFGVLIYIVALCWAVRPPNFKRYLKERRKG